MMRGGTDYRESDFDFGRDGRSLGAPQAGHVDGAARPRAALKENDASHSAAERGLAHRAASC
jgi:hypothetical protein